MVAIIRFQVGDRVLVRQEEVLGVFGNIEAREGEPLFFVRTEGGPLRASADRLIKATEDLENNIERARASLLRGDFEDQVKAGTSLSICPSPVCEYSAIFHWATPRWCPRCNAALSNSSDYLSATNGLRILKLYYPELAQLMDGFTPNEFPTIAGEPVTRIAIERWTINGPKMFDLNEFNLDKLNEEDRKRAFGKETYQIHIGNSWVTVNAEKKTFSGEVSSKVKETMEKAGYKQI